MRAAVLHGRCDVRIEERPDPVCRPGEVLIEVIYNGLCGTDATEYAKDSIMVPLHRTHPGSGHVGPTTLGHEFIGRVVATGSSAESWLGRRVACGAGISCGQCAWCAGGRTNLCASYYTLGLSIHGGLAQFVAAPAAICREIPAGCGDEDAALAQPFAVGLHAVRRAGVSAGDRIVLLGVGAIGSFIAAGLRGHDGEVIAVDVDEARLAMARALGVPTTQLVDRDADAATVGELVGGPAGVVFETSGVTGAAGRALDLTARGGTTVLVGLNQSPQPLNLAGIVLREVDVRTTVAHVCDQDLPAALERLAAQPLAPLLVDRVIALSDVVAEGFEPLRAAAVSGKILVDPRRG